MSNASQFFAQMMPHAQRVSKRTGVDPRLVLAQAALETGYGKAAPNNNFFGIKSHGREGGSNLQTREFEGGQMVSKAQSFRGYRDPGQSFDDYGQFLLDNPRYGAVLGANNLGDQINAMGRSGYATDPNYASKLAQIANSVDPNAPDMIAGNAMRAIGRNPIGATIQSTTGAGASPALLGSEGNDTMTTPTPEPQQRGLLFNMLPEKAHGFMTPERVARTQMALEGMTMNPNQGVMAAAQQTLKTAGDSKQRNKTVEWLAKNGHGELAQGVMSGAIPATAAIQAALKPPEDERTSQIKNYEYFRASGLSHDAALQASSGGTNISVNTGSNGVDFGKPQDGTVWQRDAQGEVVMDERGAPIAIPYQGSKAYQAQQDTAVETEAQKIAAQAKQALESRAGGVVIEDIGRLKKAVESAPWYSPAVGLGAGLLDNIGGTNATDAKALAMTIKGNIGFDRLQQMRDASPTGGALGQVSEQELATLQGVLGSLETSQSEEQFLQNLDRLGQIYNDVMSKFAAYPNAAEFGFSVNQTANPPTGGTSQTIPKQFEQYLDPSQ